MAFDLNGCAVLVSGGAGDIGSAIVRGFAEEGCRIVIGDINIQAAEKVKQELASTGATIDVCALDVTDEASVRQAVAFSAQRMGRLDVLVNVAGVLDRNDIFSVSREAFQQSLDINVMGPFFLSREAALVMKNQGGGRIINISSLNGSAAIENRSVYGATKAALNMLTKSMAMELGAHGITVNAVAPGVVDSAMCRVRLNTQELRDQFARNIPIGRLATPDDVRHSVLFLASPYASGITGEVLLVDGGITARQALPRV